MLSRFYPRKVIQNVIRCSSYMKGAQFTARDGATLNDVLIEACESHPDKVQCWIQMEGREITFQEMNELSENLACGLIAAGHKPGDRLAIWGPNQSQWVITKWACYKAGLQLVTLNPMYTARELEYAINKVSIACLICPRQIGPLDYHATIEKMCPMLQTGTKGDLKFSNVPTLKSVVYYNAEEEFGGVFQFNDLLAAGGSNDLDFIKGIKIDPHSPANIQFTSGTTGNPKAAALSHFNMVNNAKAMMEIATQTFYEDSTQDHSLPPPLCEHTVWNCLVPLYHVFGFVGVSLVSAMARCELLFPHPGFSSDAALNSVQTRGATVMSGTPTMIIDILNNEDISDYDVSTLRYLSVGGAPVTQSLIQRCDDDLGARLVVAYGMTENTCGTISTNALTDACEIAGAIGRPFPGVEVKIVDCDTFEEVGPDTVGEICTRGYTQFLGYVNDEDKTQESMLPGGWWRTGDLGILCGKHNVYRVEGRSKDMIIRGGENIQPTEIENYYAEHTGITDCYVIGVPSQRYGEEVAAYISLTDKSITEEDITEYGREGLARFKVPKYIKFVEEFPKTITGKVKKYILREQAMEDFPNLKSEVE